MKLDTTVELLASSSFLSSIQYYTYRPGTKRFSITREEAGRPVSFGQTVHLLVIANK